MTDCQNEFFVGKVKEIKASISQPKSDPLMILRELMQKRTYQLNFSPVHPDEVLKILKDLTNSAAVGLDGIDTYVLKLVKEELNPAIVASPLWTCN